MFELEGLHKPSDVRVDRSIAAPQLVRALDAGGLAELQDAPIGLPEPGHVGTGTDLDGPPPLANHRPVVVVSAQQLVELNAVVLVVGRHLERSRAAVRQRQHGVDGTLAALHVPGVGYRTRHSLGDEASGPLVVSKFCQSLIHDPMPTRPGA
jgi:hypothetical protein